MSLPPHSDSSAGDLPVEWVRQALEALYDNASLAASPLCDRYQPAAGASDAVGRAQALRSLLLDCIEALRPMQHARTYSQADRCYEVLSLRYASGLTIDEIAEQLSVGARQIYRDLRRAEDKLYELLRGRCVSDTPPPAPPEHCQAMEREVTSLQRSQKTLDARDVVAAAMATVRPLADARALALAFAAPAVPVLVHGTPGVLRTALTELFSGAVQAAAPGATVSISLDCPGGRPELRIASSLGNATLRLTQALDAARATGLSPALIAHGDGSYVVVVPLPVPLARRVLVIEDNESAVGLYERYLDGTGWQVVRTSDTQSAADAARQTHPSAILLDIMMPELDGWTVLQSLRLEPSLADTPIIICSVVYDPSLAAALGASACLAKPVSRPELVAALRQVTER